MKKTLAIFDFCETLVSIQTANNFLKFVLKHDPRPTSIILEVGRICLRAFGKLNGFNHKKLQAKQLRGLSSERFSKVIRKYISEILNNKKNSLVIKKVLEHRDNGHELVIISGGFSDYIIPFAKAIGIENVIAVDLEKKDNILTGKIINGDTMGFDKVKKLQRYFNLDEYDLSKSYFYSDHPSDAPMFSLVGNKIAVVKRGGEEWALKQKYTLFYV